MAWQDHDYRKQDPSLPSFQFLKSRKPRSSLAKVATSRILFMQQDHDGHYQFPARPAQTARAVFQANLLIL